MKKDVHQNSRTAYHEEQDAGRLSRRESQIVAVLRASATPLTDRQVMRRLGYVDPNRVRPAITALTQRGILQEVGSMRDSETGKKVRLVALAPVPSPQTRLAFVT